MTSESSYAEQLWTYFRDRSPNDYKENIKVVNDETMHH